MAARYENLPGAENPRLGGDFPNVRDVLRHRGPLDATLPPTPIRELLAASGATLFVLATDAALVTTVRRAADQHPLFVVETWPELMAAVESGRCGIALIDAAVLGARVAHGVAALAAYADRLVTLVAADRAAAQDYVGFLSDGRIHRLVMKPLAIGATRLLIESATARRLQLREEPANDDASGVAAAASSRVLNWRWPAAAGVGCRRAARRRDRGGPARVVGPVRAARSKGSHRVDACRYRAYNRGRAVAGGPACRLSREGCTRARARPTRGARRRQRPRSLFFDSRSGAGRSGRARRRFGRGRRSVHARRRSIARRLARSRRRGARSRAACRSREQPSRVPRRAARARAGGIGGGAAPGGRGSAARRGFTDGARQRAEPGHGPVAPRPAAEPCRRQREGLPRSRGAGSSATIRAS